MRIKFSEFMETRWTFLLPVTARSELAYSNPTRNQVGLANRENDYDDAEKRKNGPRVQQTSTFIVGHTRGRVAMMRTIREEMEGVKKVPRSSLHVRDLRAMTESFEESKQIGIRNIRGIH